MTTRSEIKKLISHIKSCDYVYKDGGEPLFMLIMGADGYMIMKTPAVIGDDSLVYNFIKEFAGEFNFKGEGENES